MDSSLVSILIGLIASTLSLISLIRTRKIADLNESMQRLTWRHKFLDSVSRLSRLLNKVQLAESRLEAHYDFMETALRMLGENSRVKQPLLDVIVAARKVFRATETVLSEAGRILDLRWDQEDPTIDQYAQLNKLATHLENLLETHEAKILEVELLRAKLVSEIPNQNEIDKTAALQT